MLMLDRLTVPEAEPMASDIQPFVKISRRLPAWEKMPIPLQRALYKGLGKFLNPHPRLWARIRKEGKNLLIFEPKSPRPARRAYFFIHGGGWTLGSASTYSSYCAWLAERTGSSVYALDYRLAPEHPYPAALEDCINGYSELKQQLGSDISLQLIGDSAGANLALALSHRLHNMQLALPSALILYYPVLGAPGQGGSFETFGDGLLTKSMMNWFWKQYRQAEEDEGGFALRWKNYKWLPPVSLHLARHDVLFDEGFALGKALHGAGVLQNLCVQPHLPHAYLTLMKFPSVMAAMEQQIVDGKLI